MGIISLQQAKAKGLKRYYTGEPCKHGHICERKVIDRSCVECNTEKSRRHGHVARQWYHDNKEQASATAKQFYQDHKDEITARSAQWRRDNPERMLELKRNWRKTEKGLAQSRNWVAVNKEAHAGYSKDWKQRHPDLVTEYCGTRRAAKLQATPPWLTPEDRIEIRVFYREAKRLQQETNQKHHVDHIVPLQHKDVCGLHVPWNLQVLTESENAAKGNTFT